MSAMEVSLLACCDRSRFKRASCHRGTHCRFCRTGLPPVVQPAACPSSGSSLEQVRHLLARPLQRTCAQLCTRLSVLHGQSPRRGAGEARPGRGALARGPFTSLLRDAAVQQAPDDSPISSDEEGPAADQGPKQGTAAGAAASPHTHQQAVWHRAQSGHRLQGAACQLREAFCLRSALQLSCPGLRLPA